MAFDRTKPATGTAPVSSEIRNNFAHIEDVVSVEHNFSTGAHSAEIARTADLTAHINDTTTAHTASAIAVTPVGGLVATELQAALAEIDSELSTVGANTTNHISDNIAAHVASAIAVTPSGNISATNLQTALQDLDNIVSNLEVISGGGSGVSDATLKKSFFL